MTDNKGKNGYCEDCGRKLEYGANNEPMGECPATRLEYLRKQILAERISYGEIAELQSLKKYIDKGDVRLLEWAGVPKK